MNLKRKKIIIASVLLSLFPLLSTKIIHQWAGVFQLLYIALSFYGTLWVLGFELQKWEYLFFPLYPCLLGVNLLFLSNRAERTFFMSNPLGLGVLVLGGLSSNYVLFLALNILNVATVRPVPLEKAARSVLVLYGLLLSVTIFSFVFTDWNLQANWRQQLLISGLVAMVVALPLLQIFQEGVRKMPGRKLAVIGLVIFETVAILSFSASGSLIRSIFVAGVLFVLIGLQAKLLQRDFSRKVVWEHLIIFIFLIIFLLVGNLE